MAAMASSAGSIWKEITAHPSKNSRSVDAFAFHHIVYGWCGWLQSAHPLCNLVDRDCQMLLAWARNRHLVWGWTSERVQPQRPCSIVKDVSRLLSTFQPSIQSHLELI